jgi:hypothetical protein
MKGRWAAGIVPRNFAWIIKGHLAVSERPGGSAPDHRRVRRQEEILWLRAQGFTRVVSLLPSSHNLHAYEELGLNYAHVPMGVHADTPAVLGELYPQLLASLHAGDRILVHQDELGDRVAGVLAGFLWWTGMIPQVPLAISAVEHLLRRQLGAAGRTIATLAMEVPLPAEEDRRHPVPTTDETVVSLQLEERVMVASSDQAASNELSSAAPAASPTAPVVKRDAVIAEISARQTATATRRTSSGTGERQPVSPAEPARPITQPARRPTRESAPKLVKTSPRQTAAKPAKAAHATAPKPAKAAHATALKPAKAAHASAPKPAKVARQAARTSKATSSTRRKATAPRRKTGAR